MVRHMQRCVLCCNTLTGLYPSADLRSFLAQESSQVAAFVSAGFDAVLGD